MLSNWCLTAVIEEGNRVKTRNHSSHLRSLTAIVVAVLLLGFVVLRGAPVPQKTVRPYTTWSAYGGTSDSMQYSALSQINKTNVNQLEQVWFYPAPVQGPIGRFSFSPLVAGNVMYVGGKDNRAVVALDAATGKELWTHPCGGNPTNRGYSYWESRDGKDRRVIFSVNGYLQEIDARTGADIKSFGKDGVVDLAEGLGYNVSRVRRSANGPHSGMPGQVFENLIILGSAIGEGYDDPPGWIRAYDVVTGKLVWTFHTIPLPGEYGYEDWPPDAYRYTGAANVWVNFSIDQRRGIAYFPVAGATYDMYGARRKGMNLFANCMLALDARTGKRLWHFQTVHHDMWDYDNANEPKLLTVNHDGKKVDVVTLCTKTAMVFVFNRVTGEPLWPIEERPAPTNDVAPGEVPYPTQPFPTKPPPMSRLNMTVDDLNPYVEPEEAARMRRIYMAARQEGIFTPMTPGRDQISIPGEEGGTNLAGTAGDPETGFLYVRAENKISIHRLSERPGMRGGAGGTPEQQGRMFWGQLCAACHGADEAGVKNIRERAPDRLEEITRRGLGQMPGLGEANTSISPEGMKALLAYIANPAKGAGEIPAPARGGGPLLTAGPLPNGEAHRFYGQFGNYWYASNGLNMIKPPWSELIAYDLNEGTIKWRIPSGTAPGLAAKGIKDTGAVNIVRNGLTVTAGGVIFMGTEPDLTFRAYDKDTGKTLWERELQSGPEGIPAVYEVGGRQYIATFCSSGGGSRNLPNETVARKAPKHEAQGYYVFALPRTASTSMR
jgi:quinoprotein glucose dehydrogenase